MKRVLVALLVLACLLTTPALASPRKLQPSLENRRQATFAGATTGISAAAVSNFFTPSYDTYFPARLLVEVEFTGTISNTEITLSLRRRSPDGTTVISNVITRPYQVMASDGAKTTGEFEFSTKLSPSLAIGLETAITGGGTVKLFFRSADSE